MASFSGEVGISPSSITRSRSHVAASGATADTLEHICSAPFAGTVSKVSFIADATLTGANTNSRTYTLVNETQSLTAATKAFTSGVNATVSVLTDITLSGTAANLVVAAGDTIAGVTTHVGGSGLADVAGVWEVTFSRADTL